MAFCLSGVLLLFFLSVTNVLNLPQRRGDITLPSNAQRTNIKTVKEHMRPKECVLEGAAEQKELATHPQR